MAERENNSLYSNSDDNSLSQARECVSYFFPHLSVNDPETQEMGSGEAPEFIGSVAGHENASAFSPIFQVQPANTNQAEAEHTHVDVAAELESVREKAYKEGFEEGRKIGEAVQNEKVEHAVKAFTEALSALDEVREKLIREMEQEAVKLGLFLTKRIVRRESSMDPDMIFRSLEGAFRKRGDQKGVCIKMHPADAAVIQEKGLDAWGLGKEMAGIAFETCERISRGGCIIETDLGSIDATIESQLRTLEDALQLALGNESDEG